MDYMKNEGTSGMKGKRIFWAEVAYILGLPGIALGTAFMATSDFGVSMIVAPAYLVHLKLSEIWSFVTFGVAEYIMQFLVLLLLVVAVRRFRISYLFSFVTAILYGAMLDVFLALIAVVPADSMAVRVLFYVIGLLFCTAGVSLMFHTYISPEVYELFVKELTDRYQLRITVVKTVYDCTCCLIAILLSLAFFGWGRLEGVRVGTVVCALVNGWLISRFTVFFEKHWEFRDGLKLRSYFE